MNLEKEVNQLTCVEAAKNISQYLNITIPEVPKEWTQFQKSMQKKEKFYSIIERIHDAYLFLTNKELFKQKRLSMKKDKEWLLESKKCLDEEDEAFFKRNGLNTKNEQDAWQVMHLTGCSLASYLRHTYQHPLSQNNFEQIFSTCLDDGLHCLESKYWLSIKGVSKPEIINPNFKIETQKWLLNKINEKTFGGKTLQLLEKVFVFKNKENIYYLS